MNGPEHYVEAERLLNLAQTSGAELVTDTIDRHPASVIANAVSVHANLIAAALVHATLAQAAATAESTQSSMFTMAREWRAVL